MVMASKIDRARRLARIAQERLYEDTCTIYSYEKSTNDKTHITSTQKIVSCENQPCRMSFSSIPAAGDTRVPDTLSQSIKLFLSPDITVKAGSKITVTRAGVSTTYKNSGMPAVYSTHQEINLELEAVHP